MRVGAAQIDIKIGEKACNLDKCLHWMGEAARRKVDLLVFPECALTGFVFGSFGEALQVSEAVSGESTNVLKEASRKYSITVVVGLLEIDKNKLYNTAVLVSPEGLVGKYRKTHTLCLGVDRYVTRGGDLPVFSLPQCKFGILTCYDQRFPEPARIIALKGAQAILHPANLPEGAEAYANFFNQSRACENRLFIINANRVGEERGVRFIGRSQIIDYTGKVLAEGSASAEELLMAEIEPDRANVKHVINSPGEYEFDIFRDRRADLYELIVQH